MNSNPVRNDFQTQNGPNNEQSLYLYGLQYRAAPIETTIKSGG